MGNIEILVLSIIPKSKRHDRLTPICQHLHWLLIPCCIDFKILLLLIYTALYGKAPKYLMDLLTGAPKTINAMNFVPPTNIYFRFLRLLQSDMVIDLSNLLPQHYGTPNLFQLKNVILWISLSLSLKHTCSSKHLVHRL